MKRKLLLVLAYFAVNMAQASPLPDYPFIFQSGTAKMEVAPDLALIEMTVSSRGSDAAKALAVVNASVAEIFQSFDKAKLRQSDITSSQISRTLEYAGREKRDTGPLYIVSRNVSVWVRELAAWAPLMSDLAGMKNITELETSFHSSTRNTLEAELELKAADDAAAKASRIAKSFGRKIASVMAISEAPFNALERALMTSMDGEFSPPPFIAPTGISSAIRTPANITLQKSLNVLFKLE